MSSDLLTEVLVALCTRGVFLGARFSVGPHTPSVRDATTPEWAVLDLSGSPVVLAHDAFQAARWFAKVEQGEIDLSDYGLLELPICLPSDADELAWAKAEQRRDLFCLWLI